jgi:hypothetical protein
LPTRSGTGLRPLFRPCSSCSPCSHLLTGRHRAIYPCLNGRWRARRGVLALSRSPVGCSLDDLDTADTRCVKAMGDLSLGGWRNRQPWGVRSWPRPAAPTCCAKHALDRMPFLRCQTRSIRV